jgi:hypothetical protein
MFFDFVYDCVTHIAYKNCENYTKLKLGTCNKVFVLFVYYNERFHLIIRLKCMIFT